VARRRTALALALALVASVTACGSDDPLTHPWRPGGPAAPTAAAPTGDATGRLDGAGASSQESAMQAWIAGFQAANPGATVSYDPVGSGGGRTQFVEGAVDLAGTDAPLDADELAAARARCAPGEVVELPLYASPIAVVFRLEGVDRLAMSPATLAGVFARTITRWDAPEIAADNPGVALPDLPITPVHRSDESGTTETFTAYLAEAAPEAWPYEPAGTWPLEGGQSAQGTSGVVQTVADGDGTIGYADASKAGGLGTVALRVGDAEVSLSAEAAAALVAASPVEQGRGPASLVLDLDHASAEGYPIVLVSYTLACTAYDDAATADLVAAFLGYVASEAGQDAAAQAAGVAPLAPGLRERALDVVALVGDRS
jgi:phosphate transport system substrate-binding protein